jgi:hypothetical protein
MVAFPDRKQTRSEEQSEFPITGPFGGIQSELSLTAIEPYGFADSLNIMYRQGCATVRPGYTALPVFPAGPEPIVGMADFYDVAGTYHSVVFTPTKLLSWNPLTQAWINIPGGPAFTGLATDLFSWDVVNFKLAFSQGKDKIMLWDGIAANYILSSASAPASLYMAEINLHLIAANTLEGGVRFPSRYHWSGSGDPTDWTSLNSGLNDELNNLGPITGIIKLGLYGFGFHQDGIVEIVPTGNGLAPFAFYPIINASEGSNYPYTLDHVDLDGQECAVFIGPDNVLLFNGTSIIPIGDSPIDGRRRLGARSRILADLRLVNQTQPFGRVSYVINGTFFKAYWLVIPSIAVWVYNFDEGNWTRFTYDKVLNLIGKFINPTGVRWVDLLGTWSSQNYAWNSLVTRPGFDFAFGATDGTVGLIDFSNYSESPWSILSAKHIFGDRRHKHTVKKFRLVVKDLGNVTYTITMTNESGRTVTKTVNLGNGSGDDLTAVVEMGITGLRLQWQVSGPVKAPGSFVEFAPIFDVGGEQRGGSADNN